MKINLNRFRQSPWAFMSVFFMLLTFSSLWFMITMHHFFVSETKDWHVRLLGWIIVITLPPYILFFGWILYDGFIAEEDHDVVYED